MMTKERTVNIHTLRVYAIQNFLVFIDGKRYSYDALTQIKGYHSYKVVSEDLREIKVTNNDQK